MQHHVYFMPILILLSIDQKSTNINFNKLNGFLILSNIVFLI